MLDTIRSSMVKAQELRVMDFDLRFSQKALERKGIWDQGLGV